ncbi:MAG: YeeE/YedE thiosulfate transporter family protein, partial [Sulfurimonas sp.]
IAGLKITPKAFFIFAFGGFIMGFGTRLSNGCNVGALFTPIAEFSLSGWLYLVFVVAGGFAGNAFIKRFISKSCSF